MTRSGPTIAPSVGEIEGEVHGIVRWCHVIYEVVTSRPGMINSVVTVKPATMNIVFHAIFTKPGIEIDGRHHELRWGSNSIEVADDCARIGVYFHYRGRPNQRLALTEKVLDHGLGARVTARLGIRNSARFRIIEP